MAPVVHAYTCPVTFAVHAGTSEGAEQAVQEAAEGTVGQPGIIFGAAREGDSDDVAADGTPMWLVSATAVTPAATAADACDRTEVHVEKVRETGGLVWARVDEDPEVLEPGPQALSCLMAALAANQGCWHANTTPNHLDYLAAVAQDTINAMPEDDAKRALLDAATAGTARYPQYAGDYTDGLWTIMTMPRSMNLKGPGWNAGDRALVAPRDEDDEVEVWTVRHHMDVIVDRHEVMHRRGSDIEEVVELIRDSDAEQVVEHAMRLDDDALAALDRKDLRDLAWFAADVENEHAELRFTDAYRARARRDGRHLDEL